MTTLLLGGCVGYSVPEKPAPPTTSPVAQSPIAEKNEPTEVTERSDEVPLKKDEPNSPSTSLVLTNNEPPADRTWVSPGKVCIGNYYPGGRAEYPIIVHNGKDTAASFTVSYRYPDHVATGYDKPPIEAQDWIVIADPTPVLAPKETKDILVVLAMPKDTVIGSKKWEFWISTVDSTTKGMIVTELAIRWLIDMR